MKKMVKEALEKKVVWPWVAPNEDDSSRRKNILKSSGFKEWKNPKAKSAAENKWKLRYAIEAKTGKFELFFVKMIHKNFQIPPDNLAVTQMALHPPPTRKVKTMTKTTKYKLTKGQVDIVN